MKPTVLFILHLPPPVHGAAMVGKYIHDSKLINDTFDCHYINLTTAKNLQDIGKGGVRKLWKFCRLLARILYSVRTIKPQLVYVTPNACGGAFYKDFVVVQLLKAMGCKVVVHYHNKGVKTRQDRWLDDKLYRRFFRGLKVILLAESLYDDVKKYVRREDVFICPNGIPDTLNHEPVAERHNAVPHILFLSNLLVSKGVIVLLDALKILKDKGYSFVCDFVGGETAEIDARRFAQEVDARGLNQLAVYQGKKYGDEKEKFFEKSDVFVFPTFYHNETFGLVNLEAMQHKLPVISTDEGGIQDVVKEGENGLIAFKENPQSLAACIETLLGDKELREKMGEDGYRKFKDYFTLSAFEQHFVQSVNKSLIGGVKCNLTFFHGRKIGDEKETFWCNADIFVFPTFYPNECFPLVLLEAMQHGLPCISTNEGGISGIIEDGRTGLLVERLNPKMLAKKIEALLEDKTLCDHMGKAGREKFQKEFRQEVFEERVKNVLKTCLC